MEPELNDIWAEQVVVLQRALDAERVQSQQWKEAFERQADDVAYLKGQITKGNLELGKRDAQLTTFQAHIETLCRSVWSDTGVYGMPDGDVYDVKQGPTYATLQAQLRQAEEKYHELIMAVGNKCPGETRHQTAVRYIQQAETATLTAQDAGKVTLAYPNDVLSGELKPHPTEERHE